MTDHGDHDRSTNPADRRIAPRASVRIMADLRRVGRTPFRVTVADLSETGCRCETVSRVESGDRVWITIPGFAPIEGMVRWVTPRDFGCEWSTPIYVSVYDHIRARYPFLVN